MVKEKSIVALVEQMVRIKVKQNNRIWPPPCVGIFHQPKRPISTKKFDKEENTL